jgi:type-F conjugative transfer system pilin assembly protein TrbC
VWFRFMSAVAILFNVSYALADELNEVADQAWQRASLYQDKAKEIELAADNNVKSLAANQDQEVGRNGISIDHLIGEYKGKFLKSKANPNLLIFISFSLSGQNIIQYAHEAKKIGASLVLRGMHEGSLQKTIIKLYELNKEGVAAIIDPKSFEQYRITHVPSIVLTKGNSCENCTLIFDKVSGNISLEYALQLFAQKGDTKEIAAKLLKEGI